MNLLEGDDELYPDLFFPSASVGGFFYRFCQKMTTINVTNIHILYN